MTGACVRRRVAVGAISLAACTLGVSFGATRAIAKAPDVYGWWAQTSLGAVGAPAPPDVPADGMYIQNLPSGPSAIAALNFAVSPGTSRGLLTLKITGTPVISQPPIACPATSSFKAVEDGSWADKPTYDCSHPVSGVVDSGKTQVKFAIDKLIRPDGSLSVVVLAAGATDRVAFNKPNGGSLQTPQPASASPAPSPTRNTSTAAPRTNPSSAAHAPAALPPAGPPAALPPGATTVTTPPARGPVVASRSAGPQAATAATTVTPTASHSLRRRLGEVFGVGLLLLCLLYWTDGFGALPLRSRLVRRTKPRIA